MRCCTDLKVVEIELRFRTDWLTKRTRGSSQSRDHNNWEDIGRALFIDLLVQVKV